MPRGCMAQKWRRQILLFLLAVLVPAAVLVTLAVRLVGQERELSAKRVEAARRDAIEQLRRELSARLDPAIVFVAPIEQDRMVLPWERHDRPRSSAGFNALLRDGETSEFIANDFPAAAAFYGKAADSTASAFDRCDGRLRLGRVLFKDGRNTDAADVFKSMLRDCGSVTDEDGIAFAWYAAERLVTDDGAGSDIVRDFVLHNAGVNRSTSLIQAYLMRSLLNHLPGVDPAVVQKLATDIHRMEEMAALARDLHAPLFRMEFTLGARPGDSAWLASGDEPWLVTIVSPAPLTSPMVLAVSSKQIAPSGTTLVAGHTDSSVRVGEGLLGLEVEWPKDRFAAAGQGVPASLYGTAIALILSTTIFAGYLLLRDVMRESQIAEMRALFVASVSHELKTPLTAIRLFAETLGKERPPDETRRTDYARTIVNESERLSRLVDNLLDSSRIEYGEKIYRKKWISGADVVRSAAAAMEYPLAQKGFELHIAIEEGLPLLFADADAIQQAILNLLTNAMKYSGDARSIHLRLKRSLDNVLIEVMDQGLGIDEVDQERIFDRFYRVRSEPTDRITGAGLGLTLARHIVNAHGGRLEVVSAPGQGSTFTVRFPVVAS
jgi:signal transduction histidine kinase